MRKRLRTPSFGTVRPSILFFFFAYVLWPCGPDHSSDAAYDHVKHHVLCYMHMQNHCCLLELIVVCALQHLSIRPLRNHSYHPQIPTSPTRRPRGAAVRSSRRRRRCRRRYQRRRRSGRPATALATCCGLSAAARWSTAGSDRRHPAAAAANGGPIRDGAGADRGRGERRGASRLRPAAPFHCRYPRRPR